MNHPLHRSAGPLVGSYQHLDQNKFWPNGMQALWPHALLRAEDREIMEQTGALPSEVWA
jgi:hypothetical protein